MKLKETGGTSRKFKMKNLCSTMLWVKASNKIYVDVNKYIKSLASIDIFSN